MHNCGCVSRSKSQYVHAVQGVHVLWWALVAPSVCFRGEHILLCHHPLLLPTLLHNQTQMVPGTDTSSLCFDFCESDGAISSQEAQK